MVKYHVLQANLKGNYQIIVHIDVPVGNNSANKSWKDVLLAANLTGPKAKTRPHDTIPGDSVYNGSVLVTGSDGHGWQITAAELAELVSGDKIEISVGISQKSGVSLAELDSLATKAVNEVIANEKLKLKYYGIANTP